MALLCATASVVLAWPTARGELCSALASAPYVLTLPRGMAEHTCARHSCAVVDM